MSTSVKERLTDFASLRLFVPDLVTVVSEDKDSIENRVFDGVRGISLDAVTADFVSEMELDALFVNDDVNTKSTVFESTLDLVREPDCWMLKDKDVETLAEREASTEACSVGKSDFEMETFEEKDVLRETVSRKEGVSGDSVFEALEVRVRVMLRRLRVPVASGELE